MKTIENSMTSREFKDFIQFNDLEVFTQEQVTAYAVHIASNLKKSTEDEINVSKKELNSMKPIKVVEEKEGRIVKSMFYVRERQIEETIEKSENGDKTKITFIDTELNRQLGRVGITFEKACKNEFSKSEEIKTYAELKRKGISDPKGELKKAYPDVDAEEIEKAFNDMTAPKEEKEDIETEDDDDDDEVEDDEVEKSENLDLIKGKAAMVGEIREWGGKKYKKDAGGKWTEVTEGKPEGKREEESDDKASSSGESIDSHADNASDKALKRASKESDDPKVVEAAKKELKERGGDSQEEVKDDGIKELKGKKYKEAFNGQYREISEDGLDKYGHERKANELFGKMKKIDDDGDKGGKDKDEYMRLFNERKRHMEMSEKLSPKTVHESEFKTKKIKKSIDDNLTPIIDKINENFEKGLIDETTFDKAGEQLNELIKGRSTGLVKKQITDKRGHRSSRWVRIDKDQPKGREGKTEETKPAEKKELKESSVEQFDVSFFVDYKLDGDERGLILDVKSGKRPLTDLTDLHDLSKRIDQKARTYLQQFMGEKGGYAEKHKEAKPTEKKEQFEAGDVLADSEGTEWEIRSVDSKGYKLKGVDDTDARGYITFNEAEEFGFVKV